MIIYYLLFIQVISINHLVSYYNSLLYIIFINTNLNLNINLENSFIIF